MEILGITRRREQQHDVTRLREALDLAREDDVVAVVVADAGQQRAIGAERDGRERPAVFEKTSDQLGGEVLGFGGAATVATRDDFFPGVQSAQDQIAGAVDLRTQSSEALKGLERGLLGRLEIHAREANRGPTCQQARVCQLRSHFMRFASVTLQHFRNLPLVDVRFAGRRTFLCGANGQGKSNFLEALGYVTALRSFRGAEPRALVALNQKQAGLGVVVEHEQFGESRITITLGADGRVVEWERGRVTRLADFIGKFPTVVFSSQDNQLLRGSPSLRRRWLDLTLAAMDAAYLTALQGYTRAVAERNMLLKQGARDAGSLDAFERGAATHAVRLVAARQAGVAALSELFRAAHAKLVPEGEQAALIYAPDTAAQSADEFTAQLLRSRPRDTLLKSTERGPHRDDLEFVLNGRPAKHFASEGQQRCLVIALRLAQAAYFRARSGVEPVLLCDDVLGELDPERRARFWASLEGEPQVIATGTSLPDGDRAGSQVFAVREGRIEADGSI